MRAARAISLACFMAASCSEAVTNERASAHWVSAEEYPVLLTEANAGDWRAAQRLGLYRFFELNEPASTDEETERLYRIWANGDPSGNAALAHLLAMRCAVEDRREAVQLIEQVIDENIAVPGDPELQSLRRTLEEYRRDLRSSDPPEDCVRL